MEIARVCWVAFCKMPKDKQFCIGHMIVEKCNMKKTFTEKVRGVLRKIPTGKTMSYAEVAQKAGSPKAYRVVASVVSKNYDKDIPCHRVIKSDGTLGEYNRGGTKAKAALLKKEGAL